MEFIVFHVALGSKEAIHPNQTLVHDEYVSMIDMMLKSARLFHPGMKATILTDLYTDLNSLSFPVRRIVNSVQPNKLMLERTKAQLSYIQANDFSVPIVILDSDILINGSLSQVVNQQFDVALTWRANLEMPINGGFMILNNQRPEISKKFFEQFTSIYIEKYADKSDWFGDQLALRDCIKLNHMQMADQNIVEIDGCRILLLPCDVYNFSPKNQYQAICSSLSDKLVLHFKGERKRLMFSFWRAWLKPRQSRGPLAWLMGWQERMRLKYQSCREYTAFATANKNDI